MLLLWCIDQMCADGWRSNSNRCCVSLRCHRVRLSVAKRRVCNGCSDQPVDSEEESCAPSLSFLLSLSLRLPLLRSLVYEHQPDDRYSHKIHLGKARSASMISRRMTGVLVSHQTGVLRFPCGQMRFFLFLLFVKQAMGH